MQKKLVLSLKTLKKFLSDNSAMNTELEESIEKLIKAINQVKVEVVEKVSDILPAPKEIADDPRAVALFSDGGCRGNPGPGAWAYVAQNHAGEIIIQRSEFEVMTTNNKMELSGALKGLQDLANNLKFFQQDPLLTTVKVITDSKYVVEGMNSWSAGWKSRGWKKADGKAPENLEIWQSLDQVVSRFYKVNWQWVKGHGGHPQNEYCDRMANELMDKSLN